MRTACASLVVVVTCSVGSTLSAQEAARPQCREWQECRRQALEAAAQQDFQRFHDLAWRAMQAAPPRTAEVMLMLARAQALSGRPHDALVMIQRLVEMGVAVDVGADEFRRTRELPAWPEVAARVSAMPRSQDASSTSVELAAPTRPRSPAPTARPTDAAAVRTGPAPAPPSSSPPAGAAPPTAPALSPPRPAPSAAAAPTAAVPRVPPNGPAARGTAPARVLPIAPAPRADVAQFSTQFSPGGLAYDAVSLRFVIGDALARKLMVVGVGGHAPTDMVRADSAGFEDVAAVEIDAERGDLWVAGAAGRLHRLQLISGRPLKVYAPAPALGEVRLLDLAVTPTGGVLGLDGAGRRILRLPRGGDQWQLVMPLETAATSFALQGDNILFVAHAEGLTRLDLRSRTSRSVPPPDGLDLRRLEQVRSHHGRLVVVQGSEDDTWRIVRLTLDVSGRRMTEATVIDEQHGDRPVRPFVAIAQDELYYLAAASAGETAGTYVVRRLSLP